MVSCQKGPTRHAYAWQIGPFWQDTLELHVIKIVWVHPEHLPNAKFLFHMHWLQLSKQSSGHRDPQFKGKIFAISS